MFLDNLFNEEWKQLIFVVHIFKESTVQLMVWNLIVAIRIPGPRCCCRLHHMNNSGHVQHNTCAKSGWNCSNSWCFTVRLLSSCLSETSNDLPDLLVPLVFFKTKNSVIAASGRDCTDVKSCVIIRIYILHTTRLVSILVRSDRLPNVTNPLRWIVFATVTITLSECVLNVLCTKVFAKLMDPRKRSDDFLLHNCISRDGYRHMVVLSQLLVNIISSALVVRIKYM